MHTQIHISLGSLPCRYCFLAMAKDSAKQGKFVAERSNCTPSLPHLAGFCLDNLDLSAFPTNMTFPITFSLNIFLCLIPYGTDIRRTELCPKHHPEKTAFFSLGNCISPVSAKTSRNRSFTPTACRKIQHKTLTQLPIILANSHNNKQQTTGKSEFKKKKKLQNCAV